MLAALSYTFDNVMLRSKQALNNLASPDEVVLLSSKGQLDAAGIEHLEALLDNSSKVLDKARRVIKDEWDGKEPWRADKAILLFGVPAAARHVFEGKDADCKSDQLLRSNFQSCSTVELFVPNFCSAD